MNVDYNEIRMFKDRIRIFFIIYFFSESYCGSDYSDCCRVLHTELKIQKIDFLLRNPDYLSYELLELCKDKEIDRLEIKNVIKEIFNQKEPEIRRLEMEKFFFGAYEDIDQVIAFLVSVGFVVYVSGRDNQMRTIRKSYYVTKVANEKMQNNIKNMEELNWYVKRCKLIQKYFGDYSGTDLKALQYEITEYKNTSYREYICSIEEQVRQKYYEEYGEKL